MNPCNSLAIGNLDDDPEDLTFYGEDPEGQTPLSEESDKVELFPALLSYQTSIMMNPQLIYLNLLITLSVLQLNKLLRHFFLHFFIKNLKFLLILKHQGAQY